MPTFRKFAVALFLLAGPSGLVAQESPLAITGLFSSGFYDTWTRGQTNQKVSFVPAGARFNIDGYYLSPDFLNYSLQPELDLGPQASEAGFQGGNGINLRVTALRRRFPLTFRYSNVQISDVYFGSLSQVSAYRFATRTKDLGLTWIVKPKDLPTLTIDWGRGSVGSASGLAGFPDYVSNLSHVNLDTKYDWRGWDITGLSHWQWQESNLFSTQGDAAGAGIVKQDLFQLQGSGRRSILSDSEVYVDGGRQATSNLLLNLPLHLTTTFGNGNMRFFQRRRWKAAVHAGYSSNLTGQLLSQYLSGVSGAGAGSVLADTTSLAPFQRSVSNLNLNATTSLDIRHGFSLFGRADRTGISEAAVAESLSANYTTVSGGATYSHKLGWGNISGQYGRELGSGSVIGQVGRISGDNYVVSIQQGARQGTLVDWTVRGSSQKIEGVRPAKDHSFATELSVGQSIAGRLNARVGGGWQQGTFESAGIQFLTKGYTGRVSLEHPRLQFAATLNSSAGNSLPLYSQLYSDVILGSVLTGGLRTVPSNLRAISISFHAIPLRKVELSALWTHSLQHLDGIVNNDFEILDAHLTYHFRRINLDAGYTLSNQILTTFTTYPDTRRGRLYVRVSRSARLR